MADETGTMVALSRAEGSDRATTIVQIGPAVIDGDDSARGVLQAQWLYRALRDSLPRSTLDALMTALVDNWATRQQRGAHRARLPVTLEDFCEMVDLLRKTRNAVQGVPDAIVPAHAIVALFDRIEAQGIDVDDLDVEEFEP